MTSGILSVNPLHIFLLQHFQFSSNRLSLTNICIVTESQSNSKLFYISESVWRADNFQKLVLIWFCCLFGISVNLKWVYTLCTNILHWNMKACIRRGLFTFASTILWLCGFKDCFLPVELHICSCYVWASVIP